MVPPLLYSGDVKAWCGTMQSLQRLHPPHQCARVNVAALAVRGTKCIAIFQICSARLISVLTHVVVRKPVSSIGRHADVDGEPADQMTADLSVATPRKIVHVSFFRRYFIRRSSHTNHKALFKLAV